MAEIKYVKDHKSGNRFYPIVKSACIIDAFNINEPSIDYLFNKITDYSIKESTSNVVITPGSSKSFTLQLKTSGPIDESDINWESSNTNVATVDNGTVTALSEGNTTITASSNLYDLFIKIPIRVCNLDDIYWSITYRSSVEVPHVMEKVPDAIKSQNKYWYSMTATALNEDTLLTTNYIASAYDANTKTGKWFFDSPALGIQLGMSVPYSNDVFAEAMQSAVLAAPSFYASANNISEGHVDYIQDVTSVVSLSYEDGPETLTDLCIDDFINLEELNLPTTIKVMILGTGLFQTCLYRNIPKVVQSMNYSYTLPKNIEELKLTHPGSDAFGSNFGPGYDFSVFHYLSVDPDNQYYDSRENCNAIIHTATNTLICGCRNTIIPSSVTTIDSSAFTGCEDIERLVIPGTIKSINGPVFGKTSGKEIIFEEGVETLTHECFRGSTIQSVTLPVSITTIGNSSIPVFYENNLTINYSGTMAQWESISKEGWTMYSNITINCSNGTITA